MAFADGSHGFVMAGLDPAIHRFRKTLFSMDARVKPAHDEARVEAVI